MDESRVYLMEHSMGGLGTCYLSEKYRDKQVGLAPIADGTASGLSRGAGSDSRFDPRFRVSEDLRIFRPEQAAVIFVTLTA